LKFSTNRWLRGITAEQLQQVSGSAAVKAATATAAAATAAVARAIAASIAAEVASPTAAGSRYIHTLSHIHSFTSTPTSPTLQPPPADTHTEPYSDQICGSFLDDDPSDLVLQLPMRDRVIFPHLLIPKPRLEDIKG